MMLSLVLLAALSSALAADGEAMVMVPDPLDVDDGITVYAQPAPYEAQQIHPNYFRFGGLQQSTGYYPSSGGLFNLGNKYYPSPWHNYNLGNPVGSFSDLVSSYLSRIQSFLGSANQGVQQIISAAQNFKDTYKYQYTPPRPGIFSSLLQHKYPGYQFRNSLPPASADEVQQSGPAPVYQVIAVAPIYDAPPLQVSDLLRQRAMNMDATRPAEVAETSQVEGEEVGYAVKSAIQKELTREMSKEEGSVVVEEADIEHFAKDVAEEVAHVVMEASKKPGKISEVVVKVDAAGVDSEEDDETMVGDTNVHGDKKHDSIAAPVKEKDSKTPVVNKDSVAKKPIDDDDDDSDDDSSDSSDSSDESDSTEAPSPPPVKPEAGAKKETKFPPKKVIAEDDSSDSSEDSSDESVEPVKVPSQRNTAGARPLRTELEYVLMKGQPASGHKTQ